MVRSQPAQQPALAQVSAKQLVQVQEREPARALVLRREQRLVQAHYLRPPQLQSQFLRQQCHLREHEFR